VQTAPVATSGTAAPRRKQRRLHRADAQSMLTPMRARCKPSDREIYGVFIEARDSDMPLLYRQPYSEAHHHEVTSCRACTLPASAFYVSPVETGARTPCRIRLMRGGGQAARRRADAQSGE
jgi:hypothetical protein